jgi:hypothetical protein
MTASPSWPPVTGASHRGSVVAGTVIGGALVGEAIALAPGLGALALASALLAFCVWRVPATAAVLTIAITPLVAGIDRGRLVPVLRPNEALVAALAVILIVRALVQLRPGQRITFRPSRLEAALVLLAVANSFLPLLWMLLRGRTIEPDDISYALVLWKYLAVYAVVRATVRTERAVQCCLWAFLGSASVVAVIGILQALDLLGMRQLLVGYYAPFGYTGALAQPRGGSTLALPAAAADLLILALAITIGLWTKDRRRPLLLGTAALLFVLGALAAAEFSSALGLLVAIVCVAVGVRRVRLLAYAPLLVVPAVVVLLPVINHRLTGFQGSNGLPDSWITRLSNLQNYFWPELFTGWNPVLGVRPAARVIVENQGTGYVWIESGYTWLLWGGGLPLFLAFCWFVYVACRAMWARSRPLTTYAAVAALAAFAGVVMVTFLMLFDPHLTYRGAADGLYALFALATVRRAVAPDARREPLLARTGGRP